MQLRLRTFCWIFVCTFGAPSVLQSDNGREFANSIINELSSMWDGLKIVYGKPRHSQSQGSVERTNRDIEDIIMVSKKFDYQLGRCPAFRSSKEKQCPPRGSKM